MFYKSLTFKTTTDEFIHLADIDEIRASQFTDETGLLHVLSNGALLESEHIWIRIGINVYALHLKSEYNATSAGVDIGHYTYAPDLTVEEKMERAIVEVWCSLKHPETAGYYKDRKVGEY